MNHRCYDLCGVRVFECAVEGTPVKRDRDAIDLIAAASSQRAELIVIPIERLGDEFFQLKTKIAGEVIQKFVTYRVRLAILGDISQYLNESRALRAFVQECNCESQVWFVKNLSDLSLKLQNR